MSRKRKSRNTNLVLNDSAVATKQLGHVVLNLQTNKASIRHDSMEGRNYLVVPCVMLTEGVHAGSEGPLYYPAAELARTPAVWNSKPIVVYHPSVNGVGVSACDPDIFDKQKIGLLMKTEFVAATKKDKAKLRTECWIEEDKADEVDERVLEAINNNKMIEVSTGLFTENEESSGTWGDEEYTHIARNYKPDHLAILPDQKGACSIDDGAGLLRNAAKDDNTPTTLLAKSLEVVLNELSHNDIWKELNDKIRSVSKDDMSWVGEIFDDFFIYESKGKTYYQKYTIDDDEVKLEGVRQEATKQTRYKLADGSLVGNTVQGGGLEKKGLDMDREKAVDQLISNAKSPWTEDNREMLMGLSDEQFALITNGDKSEKGQGEGKEGEATPPAAPEAGTAPEAPATENTPTGNSVPKEVTAEEYITNAPAEIQDMLRSGLAAHAQEKSKLIATITANERNIFTPEGLNLKGLDELRALAKLAEALQAQPTGNVVPPVPLYIGQGGETPPTSNTSNPEEPLEMEPMDFSDGK